MQDEELVGRRWGCAGEAGEIKAGRKVSGTQFGGRGLRIHAHAFDLAAEKIVDNDFSAALKMTGQVEGHPVIRGLWAGGDADCLWSARSGLPMWINSQGRTETIEVHRSTAAHRETKRRRDLGRDDLEIEAVAFKGGGEAQQRTRAAVMHSKLPGLREQADDFLTRDVGVDISGKELGVIAGSGPSKTRVARINRKDGVAAAAGLFGEASEQQRVRFTRANDDRALIADRAWAKDGVIGDADIRDRGVSPIGFDLLETDVILPANCVGVAPPDAASEETSGRQRVDRCLKRSHRQNKLQIHSGELCDYG